MYIYDKNIICIHIEIYIALKESEHKAPSADGYAVDAVRNMVVPRCSGIGPPSGIPYSGLCFCWLPIYVVIQLSIYRRLGSTPPRSTV